MRKMFVGVMMVVLSLVIAGVMAGGEVCAAVSCPPGSARENADTYAQCNIREEDVQAVGNGDIWGTVSTVLNVVVGIMGIAAVAVIILGAFNFLTSQGDAAKVTKGKNTIIWGIVGLIVAIMAFAIVNFILDSFFGNGAGSGTSGGSNSGSGGTSQQSTQSDGTGTSGNF